MLVLEVSNTTAYLTIITKLKFLEEKEKLSKKIMYNIKPSDLLLLLLLVMLKL